MSQQNIDDQVNSEQEKMEDELSLKHFEDDDDLLKEDDFQMGGQNLLVKEIDAPRTPKEFKNYIQTKQFNIRFSRRFAAEPDAEKRYAEEVVRIAKESAPKNIPKKDMKVGIALESEEFSAAVGFPLQPIRMLKVYAFLKNMERLAQSDKSPLMVKNHKFLLRVVYTASPSGSGKRILVSDLLGLDLFGNSDALENKQEPTTSTAKRPKKDNEFCHEDIMEELKEDESGCTSEPENDANENDKQWDRSNQHNRTSSNKVNKQENLMLNDVPHNCLPYALQQARRFLEYIHGNKTRAYFRESLKRNKINSKTLSIDVEQMKLEAGVSKTENFTIEDVEKFQKGPFHGKYQIVVFAETSVQPIYAGPFISNEKQILLLLKDNHYQGVRYLGTLMGANYVCPTCFKKASSATTHYKCSGKHDKCGRPKMECLPEENMVPISCLLCRFTFESIKCYENHLMKGPSGGKSMCERRKCCTKCNTVYGLVKGNTHICGKKYCDICQKQQEIEHVCRMPVSKRNEKGIKKLRLYFDVESMADENGKQTPVLFISIKTCRVCGHKNIPKSLKNGILEKCDCCSPHGRVKIIECITPSNRNVDVRREMFKYLFSKENRGYVAVAHNMHSYDGQFILQEIIGKNVGEPRSLIMEGSKLTFMAFNNIRLMDSMKYLQTSLRDMGKTFNVECPKGDFPVKFIRKENFDYVGEYPPIEEYNIKDKSSSEGIKITKYVEEKRKNGTEFNFKEQLFEYCFADVVILAEAFHKFESEFEELTNVTILEESCTAASAAVKVFQRNHLKAERPIHLDQISSEMAGCSLNSQKYLAYREHIEGKMIYRKSKGGEKKIAGYKVDGYIEPCEEYPKGKVIEFNGCFYHGHCCTYRENDVIFKGSPDISAKDVRERDQIRLEMIKKEVSAIETVWECDYNKQLVTNTEMASFVKLYEVPQNIDISDALSGGRTEVFRLYYKCGKNQRLRYVDVVSLYPFVMKHCGYPIGEPYLLPLKSFETPLKKPEDIYFEGFMNVTILPPKQLRLPLLPTKIDDKLFFALCPACVRERTKTKNHACKHTDEQRCFNGTYTTMELKKALELGYIITRVKAALTYPEIAKMEYDENGEVIDDGLFGSYIDTMLKTKIYASGWPKDVTTDEEKQQFVENYRKKEGITLDKNMFEKNAGRRQASKLMLNALWGKLAQKLNMMSTSIITKPDTFWKLYHDKSTIIEGIVIVGEGLIVQHRKRHECVNILPTSAKHLAAFTTSHARLKLYSLMEKVGPDNLFYTDTDSLIYKVPDGEDDPLKEEMGEFLGQLTNELKGDMVEFVAVAPKTYAYQEQLEDGSIRTVRKSKGIRGSHAVEQVIGFELMKQMVQEVLENRPRTAVYVDLFNMKRDKTHNVYATRQKKRFAYTFEKRNVLSDGSTLPFGYSDS